jgi:chaperonin GroES
VGPGGRNDKGEIVPMDVAVGDEIIFSKYGGTEIKLGTDEVLVLRETDVLAKVVGAGAKGSKKKELAGASA